MQASKSKFCIMRMCFLYQLRAMAILGFGNSTVTWVDWVLLETLVFVLDSTEVNNHIWKFLRSYNHMHNIFAWWVALVCGFQGEVKC
eukprot:Gb_27123 [translate_table: standard]